jgi:hypothetical protein
MIPDRKINRIRQRAADDITDIIDSYVKLKRSGRGYKGLCPFHEENTPSFYVTPDMGSYKCFGCGEGGDVIDFLMKQEGFDFMEAIKHLARRYMIDISAGDGRRKTVGKSFKQQQEAILPGLPDNKHQIRKKDGVVLLLDDLPDLIKSQVPCIVVENRVSRGQFVLIKKYTHRIWLYSRDYSTQNGLKTIKNAVQTGMELKLMVLNSDETIQKQDWLQYLMQNTEQTKDFLRNIREIIAQFDNDLAYHIYKQEYIKQLK